jgi:hypothetical protein
MQSPYNQYCFACNNGAEGAYCNVYDNTLSNNTQSTQLMASGNYSAYKIPGSNNQINLYYSSDQLSV